MNDPQIDDRFFGFPPELVQIIQEYGETHSAALVPGIVHGIIDRYVPAGSGASTKSLSALGLESLTLMEVILDIQDALGLTLSDEDLRALANLDEATAILEKKVAQLSAPNESP